MTPLEALQVPGEIVTRGGARYVSCARLGRLCSLTPNQVARALAGRLAERHDLRGLWGPGPAKAHRLRDYTPPEVEAVPLGFQVRSVSTGLDAAGAPEKQWVQAGPARAAADTTVPVPDGHRVSGVSTLVSGDGQVVAQWIKTKGEAEAREDLLRRLLAELPREVAIREAPLPAPLYETDADLLAVYPLGDPHVGLLTWAPETGQDWDLSIARDVFCSAFDQITTRGPKAKRGLVYLMGDTFHADDPSNRTPASGHRLDVDGRHAKVLRVALQIFVHGIDAALRAHEQVDVVIVDGNHDPNQGLILAIGLEIHYRNEPRVKVHASPEAHKYLRFGKVLLGMTHGHRAKGPDLESIMAVDRPQDWAEALHRHWLCGHVHHRSIKEYRGCTVETFRTLAPADAWHKGQGYRSGRDLNRILYHREWGEVGREILSASWIEGQLSGMTEK